MRGREGYEITCARGHLLADDYTASFHLHIHFLRFLSPDFLHDISLSNFTYSYYWTFVIVTWLFRANLYKEEISFAFQSVTRFFSRACTWKKWREKKLDECANIIEKSWKLKGRDERFASHISRDSRRPWIAREINSLARHPVDVLIQFLLSGFFIHRRFCNVDSQRAWSINHESKHRRSSMRSKRLDCCVQALRRCYRDREEIVSSRRSEGAEWWNLCSSKTRPSTEWRGISSSEWDGNWKFEFQPTACFNQTRSVRRLRGRISGGERQREQNIVLFSAILFATSFSARNLSSLYNSHRAMNGIYIGVHEQSKIDTRRNGHSFDLIFLTFILFSLLYIGDKIRIIVINKFELLSLIN